MTRLSSVANCTKTIDSSARLHESVSRGLSFVLSTMKSFVVVLICVVFQTAQCDSVFRFGGVLNSQNEADEILDAKRGYAFAFEALNQQNDGRGFFVSGDSIGKGFYFQYDFLLGEDFGQKDTHRQEVERLLERDKVHFLGGSLPEYADDEMRLANDSNILCYHCCVHADEPYKMNYRTTYGISGSNAEYTNALIRRLSFEDIASLCIIFDENDPFAKTTAEASSQLANEIGDIRRYSGTDVRGFKGPELSPVQARALVKQCIADGTDVVLGCMSATASKNLVKAFDAERYPIKSFYLLEGPSEREWVDSFRPKSLANDLLSSLQWHPLMEYSDVYFETTADYVGQFKKKFNGQPPGEFAAAATAIVESLTEAIQLAFSTCDITKTKGDVDALLYDADAIVCSDQRPLNGNDRVIESLADVKMETIFGSVQFDVYRRNSGLKTVITQVQEKRQGKDVVRNILPVFPLGYTSTPFNFPAKNRYRGKCPPGFYVPSNVFDPCLPCPHGKITDAENALYCVDCPVGYWNNQSGQSSCNVCPEGTKTKITGSTRPTDCSCKSGYYNKAFQKGVACEPCPNGAICEGGKNPPFPIVGYWADPNKSYDIYRCEKEHVCKGGSNSDCEEGYSGRFVLIQWALFMLLSRLCAHCADDYFRAIQDCYSCLRTEVFVTLIVGLLLFWYIVSVFVSQNIASLEVMLTWMQLANVIGAISLNWTSPLRTWFGIEHIFDFDVNILEPTCLISWSFKHSFIAQLLLPIITSMMASTGCVFSSLTYFAVQKNWIKYESSFADMLSYFIDIPEDRNDLSKKVYKTVATFMASVDLMYVTLAKYCFETFRCRTVSGVSVLIASPNLECGTKEHYFLIALGVLGIILYVLGYLVFISWKLYRLYEERSFATELNLLRYGYIYEKYELQYYFTPVIALLRKFLFAFILVFMNNPAFQVFALAIVINISLMIHVYTAPYVDTYLDILFTFLLLALLFEAFGGLMFYSDNLPSTNRNILTGIVLSALFVMVCVFLVIFVIELKSLYQIRYLKTKQRDFAHKESGPYKRKLASSFQTLTKRFTDSSNRSTSMSSVSSCREDKNVSFELLHTFNPGFVYVCMKKNPALMDKWHKLSNMLKDFMCDQSESSYLSMDPSAKFWRRLVDRFPEVVDFLAVVDSKTRQPFVDFATCLYRKYYLSNKVQRLPLLDKLNWRDYAPMAQWLAITSSEEREFFVDLLSRMFEADGDIVSANLLRGKVDEGSEGASLALLFKGRKLSKKQRWILDTLNRGSSPFTHSASSNAVSSAATVAMGVVKFRQNVKKSASLRKKQDPELEPDTNEAASAEAIETLSKRLSHQMDDDDGTSSGGEGRRFSRSSSRNTNLNNTSSFRSDRTVSLKKTVSFSKEIEETSE